MTGAWLRGCALALTISLPGYAHGQAQAPLSRLELAQIVDLLVASERLGPSTRIARTTLEPVAKTGQPKRRARVALVGDDGSAEVLLDLDQNAVVQWRAIKTGRAPILSAEWARASNSLRRHPLWRKAMARRGYTAFDDIFCESLSAGYFPQTPAAGRRVLRMPCYDISQATTNIYGRPIEGLVATVDARTGEVLDILDEGVTPVPPPVRQPPEVTAEAKRAATEGPSRDGNRLTFGAWDLTARLDDQFGLIVSDAGFTHGGARREVLATGHVSEIFVPYMDPRESWAFRTYLDAGEFGLGTLTSRLRTGVDCPADAQFIPALTLSPLGKTVEKADAICAFARDMPGPLWRHEEALNGSYTGQIGRELVVRSIASIAHYDYIMDWVFRPQGDIEIRIGATGIDAVRAVAQNASGDPHGRRVTPDLSAVYHDHFFSLRLDLDIDGPANRLVREHVKRAAVRSDALGRSYWVLEPETVQHEGPLAMAGPGVWRVEAAERRNATGHPTAYQLVPDGTVSLLAADDLPQSRGAFSSHPLWVTRFDPAERASAGAYPNQSPGGQGLPRFATGEALEQSDLVLWPTVGFRHVTRPEDWPILSTLWKSVLLRPYGFFDANPTVAARR